MSHRKLRGRRDSDTYRAEVRKALSLRRVATMCTPDRCYSCEQDPETCPKHTQKRASVPYEEFGPDEITDVLDVVLEEFRSGMVKQQDLAKKATQELTSAAQQSSHPPPSPTEKR